MHNLSGTGISLAAVLVLSAPAAAITHNWTFTDTSNNVGGSGTLTTDDNIVVGGMTGTIYGKHITLFPNKPQSWFSKVLNETIQANNPVDGVSQIVGVPNTAGANVGYDDIYNFNDGVTYWGGIAISTGSLGSTTSPLRVYFLTHDSQSYDINTPTDLFSINPDGSYSQVEGTFAVTP